MIKNKMKYILAMRPNFLTPPYAKIPSYITTFQSSPVNIYFMMIGKMVEMSILDRSKGIRYKYLIFKNENEQFSKYFQRYESPEKL